MVIIIHRHGDGDVRECGGGDARWRCGGAMLAVEMPVVAMLLAAKAVGEMPRPARDGGRNESAWLGENSARSN